MNFPWLPLGGLFNAYIALFFIHRGMDQQEENGNQKYQANRDACEKTGCAGKWEGRRGFRTNGHYKHHGGYRDSRASSNRGR